MGSVVFSDTHSSTGIASATYDVRINYSETYDSSSKTTTVKLTSVQIRKRNNTTNWNNAIVYGSVTFNGTTVLSMEGSQSYTCHISGDGYYSVTNSSGGSITVSHDPITGRASITIGVVAGIFNLFAAHYYWYSPGSDDYRLLAGVPTQSTTTDLTTRAATLSVNPDGGTWNGSSSVQTFTQAIGSTKAIANPTKTGYRFNGWALSGGGSISDETYTFGSTNGTLIALWVNAAYSLSVPSTSGANIHVYKNGVELFDGDTIYYGDSLNLSITPKPGYKIESRLPASDLVVVDGDLVITVVASPMATIHIRRNANWDLYLIHIRREAQWQLHQANERKNGQWEKYF